MISVVMATYNGEKFIEEQLNSILNQTIKIDELIIIDDSSKDLTIEKIENYRKKYNNIKIFKNSENKGHFYSFIKGLSLTKGDLIFFSDQDDIWEKNKIEVMSKIYNKYKKKYICIQSSSIYIDINGKIIGKREMESSEYEEKYINILKYPGAGYEMLIDKEIKNKILEIPLELLDYFDFHDVLVAYVTLVYGTYIRINDFFNFHRIHNNNVTTNMNNKYFSQNIQGRIENIKKLELNRVKGIKKIIEDKEIFNKEEKIYWIDAYYLFLEKRLEFLKNKKIKEFLWLLQRINFYRRKETFIVDCCYALKIEKIMKKVVNKMKRRIFW